MKKCIIVVFAVLLAMIGSACSRPEGADDQESQLPSTRPTPQAGELVQITEGLLPDYSIDEIIGLSDIAVTGTVTNILPAQLGTRTNSGTKLIYTDVVLRPTMVLYGNVVSEPITVRVWGGRLDDQVEIYENEPLFALHEEVVVFLFKSSEVSSTAAQEASSYYRVRGSILGKYEVEGSDLVGFRGDKITLQAVQQKIRSAHPAES